MREEFADGALVLTGMNGVANCRIARPQRRNALTSAMWRALAAVATAVERDASILVLVVSGESDHFSAGADIGELESAFASPAGAARHQAAIEEGVEAIAAITKPVFAAINGCCFGGGVALALACDMRIARVDARFAVTPAKLGMTYPLSETRRLMRAVGLAEAKRLIFSARPIDAAEALRIGLVQDVVGESAFDAAEREAVAISRMSQHSVRAMKRLLDAVADGRPVADHIGGLATADFEEGRRAFLEKRPPQFGNV